MKINHITGHKNTTIDTSQKKINKPTGAEKEIAESSSQVHISSLSTNTQASSENREVLDVAKVAEIKQAISEGRFKVNSEVVADRLLETVKELIQNKR